MIAKLRPYAQYRDTGVPWLEKVPAHWYVRRLKTLCTRSALYGANVAATSYTTVGVRFLRTTDIDDDGHLSGDGVFVPEELVENYLLTDDDILISRSGTIGRSFLYSRRVHGRCAYAGYLVRFVPGIVVAPKYVLLFTKTHAFTGFLRAMAISSTIENVNGEKYANAPLPLPPLTEQAAIVRFLDHADRRIRRYIRAKEKLISLLEEKKQALIHEAVTGRIDVRTGRSYPAYKDSGMEWLGRVPVHWKEVALSAVAHSIQTGPFGSQLHASDYVMGGIPVINPSHMDNGSIRPDPSIAVSQQKAAELSIHRLQPADIVVARRGEVGRCALATESEAGWLCGTGSLRIRLPSGALLPAYLVGLLNSPALRDSLRLSTIGATMENINSGIVSRLRVALPPYSEQASIVDRMDRVSDQYEAAAKCTRRQIALFNMYRTRLIADVVTGKLDVQDAAASLPDVDTFAGDDVFGGGQETEDGRDAGGELDSAERKEFETVGGDEGGGVEPREAGG